MRPAAKRILIEIACYLYILLFVYASVSKLLDYQEFRVQIGQSPLLSSLAEVVPAAVIIIELLIAGLLLFPASRLSGLYMATSLMGMFSIYIYWILHYSTFIPCSCGGVLERMNWNEHLIFNLAYMALGIAAILLAPTKTALRRKIYLLLLSLFLSSILGVALIYKAGQITQYENKFVRILSATSAKKIGAHDLGLSSYYLAGSDQQHIYLGNNTAQLLLTIIDSTFKEKAVRQLKLPDTTLPYRAVSVKIAAPYVYAYDGMVPVVFKGKLARWDMKRLGSGDKFFSLAMPVSSGKMVVRTQAPVTGESIMGLVTTDLQSPTEQFPSILQKHSDGLFDTDGTLLYSSATDKIIYIYAYRNQYLSASSDLKLVSRGTTIDTISKPDLKVAHNDSRGEKKLQRMPLVVNRSAAVYNNLLFVNSGIPGKFESRAMWKRSSIVDVYDFVERRYLNSFYINDEDGKRMRSFIVEDGYLYALVGSKLVRYKLDNAVTKYYLPSGAGQKSIGQ